MVEVAADGASFSVLETFTGIIGSSSGSRGLDISSFAASGTTVRFRVTSEYGGSDEFFFLDNVESASDSCSGGG